MKEIRVLVVDDQTVVREGLVSILSFQSDIKIVGQARDGQEAIEIAKQDKPDVILLDLVMPKQDGLDSISKLREVAPAAKILILTGYADPERVFRAIKAGAIGYLLKDSTWEQLMQAIRDVAKGQSYIDSSIAIKVIQEINTEPTPPHTNHSLVLTDRELQTLRLIAKGLSNQEIAAAMFVHERTIAKYVSNILSKLQLANRTQAALYAIREGLDKE
ncbi:MAG: response regulator transcription factor [Chloroflexi bacterium]|nr:response regulator transcription factor [Chloroflexota bacterium]